MLAPEWERVLVPERERVLVLEWERVLVPELEQALALVPAQEDSFPVLKASLLVQYYQERPGGGEEPR